MCVFVRLTVLLGLNDGLLAFFAPLWIGQDHFEADVGVGGQMVHHVSGGFGVHVQAVTLGQVSTGQVVVADGDIEGVAACDVVAQRLPVHGDEASLRLRNLQGLRGPHRLCEFTNTHRLTLMTRTKTKELASNDHAMTTLHTESETTNPRHKHGALQQDYRGKRTNKEREKCLERK